MPMNPTQSDLHFNAPLTNVSVAYIQEASAYIADKVFAKVPVQHQSNAYWRFSKSDWRRTRVKKRAPGTETAGVGWNVDTDSYFCDVMGVHKDVDDQTRANADSTFKLDKTSTQFVTNQMLIQRDLDWAESYFKTGIWGTERTGVDTTPSTGEFTQWDLPTSDPIGDASRWVLEFRRQSGFKPNICVMGADVMIALKQHPDLIDRIKYTQRGVVTEDLVATLLDIDQLYVCYATIAEGPDLDDARTQDAAASYDWIVDPSSLLFAYAPGEPSIDTPAAGYTFTWTGYLGGNAEGVRVKRFRMEHIASDRVEAEMTYDMKVVCPDMGLFINTAVTALT